MNKRFLGRIGFFALSFVSAPIFLLAQNQSTTNNSQSGQSSVCTSNLAMVPCVDQPSAPNTVITGRAEPNATIEIIVGSEDKNVVHATEDGSFRLDTNPLTANETIKVTQTAPSVVTLAPITVEAQPIGMCGPSKSDKACLNEPFEKATAITGKAPKGASVTIEIDSSESHVNALKNGTFSLTVKALKAGQMISAKDQNDNISMGPITVRPSSIANICGSGGAADTCLNAPVVGASTITGKAPAGASIDISIDDGSPQTVTALKNGTFSLGVDAIASGEKIEATQKQPPVSMGPVFAEAAPNVSTSSLFTLGLVGINATGTSTSGPKQQYFAEFDLIAPVHWLPKGYGCHSYRGSDENNKKTYDDDRYPLAGKCWVWLNPRIASAPQTTSTALSSVNSATSLTQGLGSQTLGQITQTFEFQGGLEYYLTKPWNGAQLDANTRSVFSLILGGGSVTPFNSISTAPEYALSTNLGKQFNEFPNLPPLYPQLATALCSFGFTGTSTIPCPSPPATGLKTVAFVFPDRSRFYRSYFGGIRLRTFYFKGDCQNLSDFSNPCSAPDTYPGTFDARFGQDETVTGGMLRGVVLTLTGSYPLPGTSNAVRIFGSAYLRLHKNVNTRALVLVPSQSFTSLDDPSVVVQSIQPSDQDYFRLGLGVDLIALIRKWTTAASAATTSASTSKSSK